MAKLSSTTPSLVSNIQLPFKTHVLLIITHVFLFSINPYITSSIPIKPTDDDKYLPSDDPNITNLMVSHYDCAKLHNLRQFNLLNVKQCTEAPSNIQHANIQARVYVRAKAKRIRAFKCEAYAKKERKICFQGNVKYRRVDRTVWNHNTIPLPITLDPLECKNIIRHLNGTDNKILNNLNYNKTFTLLEDHYFQEQLERFQTPFTVYQFNKMYTGTFTYMPADKTWIYDPLRNPYHNCPAHHQFEVNLVSWRLAISEIELTYDDTQNVMIIDGHTLPCYFADGFCKPTTKTPFTLVWFSDDFCLIFTLQDFIGRMTKIDDRYWIETDSFVHSATPKKSPSFDGIKGTSYPHVRAPHTETPHNPSLSRFEIFPTANTFCGKPEPLYSTQYSDLFVTYTEGFNMHTGQPNPTSIINEYISGKIVLDKSNSNNKYIFPALNVSNNFATIDYDAHINTKIDYTINHVFRSMTVQELNTLHTVCELERNQLLTILAMSVQNPQLAGFLLTGNRSNFLYVEGSTAWLYDCPHFLSPLYIADRCFDRIPIHFKDTLMYVDPITRQTYDYATPITCDNNPNNIIELDPDSDDQDFYILGPEPIKRKPPLMFTPSQIKTTIRPNTFTAQDAGIYSNAELNQFWNRILFSKHSDTTLQLLGKALSYSFISSNTPDYDANEPHGNPYNTLRIGLHDRLINLTPLFTPTWFSDAFIALFGYPCYILTQCGIYFSTYLFIQTMLTLIVKLYKTISIKYNLKQNITLLNSIAHGFLNILTADMLHDLKNVRSKSTSKSSQQMSNITDNPLDESSYNLNDPNGTAPNPTGITSPPPFYTKRPNRISKMTRFKFLPKQKQYNVHSKSNPQSSLPHYSSVTTNPNDYTLTTSPVNDEIDTPVRIYSKTNYSFTPPSFQTNHSDFFTPPT